MDFFRQQYSSWHRLQSLRNSHALSVPTSVSLPIKNVFCIPSCIVSVKELVPSQPPFAASLSPPLSAPRPFKSFRLSQREHCSPSGDSAASVRDAFGILAMADLMQASFCSFGLAKRLVSSQPPFLAMADLMQASFCSFGLAKRLKNRRFNMQGNLVLWKSNLKALKKNLRASKPNLRALKMTARGS